MSIKTGAGIPRTAFDRHLGANVHLKAEADTHGGQGTTRHMEALTGRESTEAILRTAIGPEEKSITCCLGMMGSVPERRGRSKVVHIISKEKSHLATLTAKLRKLKR